MSAESAVLRMRDLPPKVQSLILCMRELPEYEQERVHKLMNALNSQEPAIRDQAHEWLRGWKRGPHSHNEVDAFLDAFTAEDEQP